LTDSIIDCPCSSISAMMEYGWIDWIDGEGWALLLEFSFFFLPEQSKKSITFTSWIRPGRAVEMVFCAFCETFGSGESKNYDYLGSNLRYEKCN
jgi:hypothetical protein